MAQTSNFLIKAWKYIIKLQTTNTRKKNLVLLLWDINTEEVETAKNWQ